MNIDLALWKVVISLPEALKRELLHYAEYLQEKYPDEQQSTEQIEPAHGYGSWSGQIVISDNFE